jgi:hypothetical protein
VREGGCRRPTQRTHHCILQGEQEASGNRESRESGIGVRESGIGSRAGQGGIRRPPRQRGPSGASIPSSEHRLRPRLLPHQFLFQRNRGFVLPVGRLALVRSTPRTNRNRGFFVSASPPIP